MSQYVPSQEDIDRLLDQAEEQGFPRVITDPSVLAPIAALLGSGEPAEEERKEGAA